MLGKKFSKDPKVKLFSIEEFVEENQYLKDIKDHQWKENKRPSYGFHYKITPKYLIAVCYSFTRGNFGMDFSEKLDCIQVALRDGETENILFNTKLSELLNKKKKSKSKKIDEEISNLRTVIKLLNEIKYIDSILPESKDFKDYIIEVGYKTSIESLLGKYVVFDVETNGFRKANDDLLSISIYDPSTGKCYNRYLPLDLQPLVLTGWINNISDEKIERVQHITQKELDEIIDFFDLNNKTLLSFSGGQGTFDYYFIINYCKRHNLVGFENLKYENIKSVCPIPQFYTDGQMTKDNLCRILKIDGIRETHSSLNDCILEWKLFEKIKTERLFFINQSLYKYNDDYVIPVTYLNTIPELKKYANIAIPNIEGRATCMFNYTLPTKILKQIKKFPTNITGISLENVICAALNAEKRDNLAFLIMNKKRLEYIGSLDSRIAQIPVEIQEDGTLKSLDSYNVDYVNEVNEVSKIIIGALVPVIEYIKKEIFKLKRIYSQELVLSSDGKIMALCDLSSEEEILEIKTYKVLRNDGTVDSKLAQQLFYESKGRELFVLSIEFDRHLNSKGIWVIKAVNVCIYNVKLEKVETKPYDWIRTLYDEETKVLNIIKMNPNITNKEIAIQLKKSQTEINAIIKALKLLKYIIKEDESKRKSKWIVLRSSEDIKTKVAFINGHITVVSD